MLSGHWRRLSAAITQTAASSASAAHRLPATHARSTGHGRRFQLRNVDRVRRMPWVSAYAEASMLS